MHNAHAAILHSHRIPQPINVVHYQARGRAVLLSGILLTLNLLGALFLWKVVRCGPEQWLVSVMLSAVVSGLIGTPLIAFLCVGWFTRYLEFQNSLKGRALSAYLQRYWSSRLIQALQDNGMLGAVVVDSVQPEEGWQRTADKQPAVCDRLFARIYHEQYGLKSFVPPFILVLCIAYIASCLLGGNYVSSRLATDKSAIYGISHQMLIASFGGALMFVVSDSVLEIRRRSLNVADVYWYALRIALAIPIALAFGGTEGTDAVHTAAVFALGTFPVDVLLKVFRRIGATHLTDIEKQSDVPDKLLTLDGVTLPIVAIMEAEGINSVEQVAAVDPVLLSIRTGFPFRYTLRQCSQAIVRRHFGTGAALLAPIGLADVVPICLLVKALDAAAIGGSRHAIDAAAIVENAATRLFPNDPPKQRTAVIEMKFRQIAAEEFTVMLSRITPLDFAL